MIDTSFLSQLDKFSLIIYKRVTSNFVGPRRSIALGRGLTFREYRPYSWGDDFRAIDWKIYGRTDNLYVKTYEEERNLIVHILVDHSSSMNFGKPITKFDYASMLGVGFAYLALKENEKFMFSTFSDDLSVFQPRKGMNHLMAMVHHLNNLKTGGNSKIQDAISHYKKLIGSRAMIILISDFLINIDEIKEALHTLGNHEIKVIQVLDPIEKNLSLLGDFKLKDSETSQILQTYISQRLRFQYKTLLSDHSNEIEKTCNKLGINFYQITTDNPIFDAFYEILR